MSHSRDRSRSPVQSGPTKIDSDGGVTELYLSNIHRHRNENQINKFIKDITKSVVKKDISHVKFFKDELSNSSRTCVVHFDDKNACKDALEKLQGIICEGKNLYAALNTDLHNMPSSPRHLTDEQKTEVKLEVNISQKVISDCDVGEYLPYLSGSGRSTYSTGSQASLYPSSSNKSPYLPELANVMPGADFLSNASGQLAPRRAYDDSAESATQRDKKRRGKRAGRGRRTKTTDAHLGGSEPVMTVHVPPGAHPIPQPSRTGGVTQRQHPASAADTARSAQPAPPMYHDAGGKRSHSNGRPETTQSGKPSRKRTRRRRRGKTAKSREGGSEPMMMVHAPPATQLTPQTSATGGVAKREHPASGCDTAGFAQAATATYRDAGGGKRSRGNECPEITQSEKSSVKRTVKVTDAHLGSSHLVMTVHAATCAQPTPQTSAIGGVAQREYPVSAGDTAASTHAAPPTYRDEGGEEHIRDNGCSETTQSGKCNRKRTRRDRRSKTAYVYPGDSEPVMTAPHASGVYPHKEKDVDKSPRGFKNPTDLHSHEGRNFTLGGPEQRDELYGISRHFLQSLNIKPPLYSTVFVANLHNDINEEKLHEVMSFAGIVLRVEIRKRKDRVTKNIATVEFDHPVEAVQAISMFHGQILLDEPMVVCQQNPPRKKFLPEGLAAFGPALGPNEEPLKSVRFAVQVESMQQFLEERIEKLSQEIDEVKRRINNTNIAINFGETNMNNTITQVVAPVNAFQPVYGYNPMAINQAEPVMNGMVQLVMRNEIAMSMQAMPSQTLAPMPVQVVPTPMSNYTTVVPMMQGPSSNQNFNTNEWKAENVNMQPHEVVNSDNNKSVRHSRHGSPDHNERTRDSSNRKSVRVSDMLVFNNLTRNVTENVLRNKMQEVGEVKTVELTGGGRALVRFAKKEHAERCQNIFNYSKVDGQIIEIDYF